MKLVILTLVLLADTRGQNLLLLLPHGVVLDQSGKPIEGAQVDHHYEPRYSVRTGKNGEFSLKDRPPAFVVRKAGYESQLIHPFKSGETNELRITLKPSDYGPGLPRCSPTQKYESLPAGQFKFPKQPGVKANSPGRDIDYQNRTYSSGKSFIVHGAGPSWSYGLPNDERVWASIRYQESVRYRGNPSDPYAPLIIDARGENPDGTRWRYLGQFGESASYNDAKPEDAARLDRFMDNWCSDR